MGYLAINQARADHNNNNNHNKKHKKQSECQSSFYRSQHSITSDAYMLQMYIKTEKNFKIKNSTQPEKKGTQKVAEAAENTENIIILCLCRCSSRRRHRRGRRRRPVAIKLQLCKLLMSCHDISKWLLLAG